MGSIASQYYTGTQIMPAVKVVLNGTTLEKGTDYVVSYKNNILVGTASVVISGIGKYTGTITKTFKILPKKSGIKELTAANKAFTVTWTKKAAGIPHRN